MALDWQRDGEHWPNRAHSHFIDAAGLRWHVQMMGQGPMLLLVHGTGASTHSWRDLAPRLAQHFSLLLLDLPGHGFTSAMKNGAQTLPGMAAAIGELLRTLALAPALAVGHSAGAAIVARMCIDRHITPAALVAINGVLLPLNGVAGVIFSPLARLLALNPLVPRAFAWRARDPAALRRLVDSTGSTLDARGLALYGQLVADPAHVAGTLAMMTWWDLRPMREALRTLNVPVLLLTGGSDRTVPPAESARAAVQIKDAQLVDLPGLGHLAHEEQPELVAAEIERFARAQGILERR
jgi:magnesium chelatase accessory protein